MYLYINSYRYSNVFTFFYTSNYIFYLFKMLKYIRHCIDRKTNNVHIFSTQTNTDVDIQQH